ncbi:MAG: type II toxin-antitoxin system Phd/YefM family antitoxin, partial [Rhizobium pusense]|nr:type II toxin-antitoxin system Phd/YefM family antitoxin [Agrobacterium pusense]
MKTTMLSSAELRRNIAKAKKAAVNGPVIVTDRGKPSHVLLTYNEFEKLTGERRSLAVALAMPGLSDIEFDPPWFADLLLAFLGEPGDIPERRRKPHWIKTAFELFVTVLALRAVRSLRFPNRCSVANPTIHTI